MVQELFELKPIKYGMYNHLEMLPYLVQHRCFVYAVYGAERNAKLVKHWIKKVYGLTPDFFIYAQAEETGQADIDGISVLSLKQFQDMHIPHAFIIAADKQYECDGHARNEINGFLAQAGADIIFDSRKFLLPFKPAWWQFIHEHADAFEKFYGRLTDDASKETLEEYLKAYVLGQRYQGKVFPEEYKYWGIDAEGSRLFRPSEQEVVLNIGAACGDTLVQYLKCGGPYKKIIAVEASERSFAQLQNTISCLDRQDQKKIQADHFCLGKEHAAVDVLYKNEGISLINMDIEGNEMDVLQSAEETIRQNRPVLSVCAYHKYDDLITIPEYIGQNFSGYQFVLRKYPSAWWEYIDGIHQVNELVLYAVPKERYTGSGQPCAEKGEHGYV